MNRTMIDYISTYCVPSNIERFQIWVKFKKIPCFPLKIGNAIHRVSISNFFTKNFHKTQIGGEHST